ncbi:MAG: FkbM family methyltransferase [Rhodospirillales bacterium]|nr:FkbM family methyltransferase [Rhodospirillales bacterium]
MIRSSLRKLKNILVGYSDSRTHAALDALPNKGVVTLVDIGAAGEIQPRWQPYTSNIEYIGFEPDKRSRDTISNRQTDFLDYRILPFALSGSTETATLNLCRKPQVSSLYEPNRNFLNRFPEAERFDVLEQLDFDCVTLDSVGLHKLDFLKIDIQGAANDVLRGANDSLDLAFGLEIEVEFMDLYLNQPLFGDVCRQMTSKGFEFLDFVDLARWQRKAYNGFGQCICGDALFLKTPESLEMQTLDVTRISAYLSILMIYRRFDLVQKALDLIEEDKRSQFDSFEQAFHKVKNRNAFVRKIFSLMDRVIRCFGSNYRLHLFE